jgi:centrin-3
MRSIARELGEALSEEEMQAMIDEFDTDHDGEISFAEFARIMKSSELYDDEDG